MSGPTDERIIHVESVVRSQDLTPAVRFKWGDLSADLTPNEARVHAFIILEAADAAMTDSFLATYLRDKVHVGPNEIAGVLSDLRSFRGDWQDKQEA
jgi:hypothetical protein